MLVVLQADEHPFNRGALLNVGYAISQCSSAWVAFHDVDMLPSDGNCDYSRPAGVRHVAGAAEQYGYELPYPNYVGGVLLANSEAFQQINGFSNQYWGWGNEDDDLFLRLWLHNVQIERRAGRYRCLPHEPSPVSLKNRVRFFQTLQSCAATHSLNVSIDPRRFRRTSPEFFLKRPTASPHGQTDGLSTLTYQEISRVSLNEFMDFPVRIESRHQVVSAHLGRLAEAQMPSRGAMSALDQHSSEQRI
jgi:hypothetical protein